MNMKIIFIFEYGNQYGLGHLARCSNLAENLKNKNLSVSLITSKNDKNPDQQIIAERFLNIFKPNIYVLDKLESKEKKIQEKNLFLINQIIKDNILIIDHYYLSKKFFTQLHSYKSLIEFKDDIYTDDIYYHLEANHKKIYFLPETILKKEYGRIAKNIFAGLDLFPLFPSNLKLRKPNVYEKNKINIFISPGSKQTNLYHEILLKINNNSFQNNFAFFTSVNINPKISNIIKIDGNKGLHNYIFYSDLVISAAGNIMLETLFFNLKMIVYCTNPNQIKLINYLKNHDKVFHIKNKDHFSEKLILKFAEANKKIPRNKNNINFCCDKLIDIILN